MWKRSLKIMAVISLQLVILFPVKGWCDDSGAFFGPLFELLVKGTAMALSPGPMDWNTLFFGSITQVDQDWWSSQFKEVNAYWDHRRQINWRGRQIEEVVSYWGPADFTASCFEDYCKPYKDAVRVYKWCIFPPKGRPEPGHGCSIYFVVDARGKIIAQQMKNLGATKITDEMICPMEAPDKPSVKEKSKKINPIESIWNWDIYAPDSELRSYRREYEARFPANPPRAFDAVVESWMGRRMDELSRAWGKPTRSWLIDPTNRKDWEKEWKEAWRPKMNFPEGVVQLNRWLIIDHTWPPPPASDFYYPEWKRIANLREYNPLMCYTAFGADNEGRIIWAGRTRSKGQGKGKGEKEYFPLATGSGCELLLADGLWSPKKAPAKP